MIRHLIVPSLAQLYFHLMAFAAETTPGKGLGDRAGRREIFQNTDREMGASVFEKALAASFRVWAAPLLFPCPD